MIKGHDTDLPKSEVIAVTEIFYGRADKQLQWKAFLRKSSLEALDPKKVIEQVASFLNPVLFNDIECQVWKPKDSWQAK